MIKLRTVAGAAATALTLAASLAAAPTVAATPAVSGSTLVSGCSGVRVAKYICMTISGPASAPTSVSATMYVGTGGRGWYGRIVITGPNGTLLVTPRTTLGVPAQYTVTVPADGPGQYNALDQVWDGYNQIYSYQEDVTLTAP